MKRMIYAILVAGMFASGVVAPALADGPEGTVKDDYSVLRELVITPEQCNYFCAGDIADWSSGQSQVRVDIVVDTLDGTTGSAPEWGIETYIGPCSNRGRLVYSVPAIDHRKYGPRVQDFPPALLVRSGSVVLFHDGPTPTQHALDAGYSGRHELACVDV